MKFRNSKLERLQRSTQLTLSSLHIGQMSFDFTDGSRKLDSRFLSVRQQLF
jgi:hypothetical protein